MTGTDPYRLLRELLANVTDDLRATFDRVSDALVRELESEPPSPTAPNEVRAQLTRLLHAINGYYTGAVTSHGPQTDEALESFYQLRRERGELLKKIGAAENAEALNVAQLRRQVRELTRERDQARHDRNVADERALTAERRLAELDALPDDLPALRAAFARPGRFVRADPGTSGGVPLTDELVRRLADDAERGYDVVLLPSDWAAQLERLVQAFDVKPPGWRDDLHQRLVDLVDDWVDAAARRAHRDASLARRADEEEESRDDG